MENGIRARGEHGRHHHNDDDRPAPRLEQARRCHDPGQFERHQDDRELEGQPEERHHDNDQAQVRDGVVDRHQVRPPDRLQPAEGVGQRDVGRRRAHEEEHEGAEDEGHGVAPLRCLEAGRHEAPDLEEDDGRGQDEPAEDGNLHSQREAVEGRRHEQVARAAVDDEERVGRAGAVMVDGVDVAQRPQQEVQDRLVGEHGDRGGHEEGDHADDHPVAQLAQVFAQRHVVGRGAVPALRSERQGDHGAADQFRPGSAGTMTSGDLGFGAGPGGVDADLGRTRPVRGSGGGVAAGDGSGRGCRCWCRGDAVVAVQTTSTERAVGAKVPLPFCETAPSVAHAASSPTPSSLRRRRRPPAPCSTGGRAGPTASGPAGRSRWWREGRAWCCGPRSPSGGGIR